MAQTDLAEDAVHAHETPEMWCSRIRDPFRKILKENPRILSGNGYITMYGMHSSCGAVYDNSYRDSHLKSCINGDTISKEYARRNDILESIDTREFQIWQYKQYILEEEAKLYRLCLELFPQSTSHSEKDKMALVSYDSDSDSITYETYKQVKMTMAENTMPSAPKFESACISPTRQEMVSPISHQSLNYKSDTGELFISSQYAKQPKGQT
ncbi:hypothetical protein C1646_753972 [Rhizophagus diaphanus]|nr:hypothetical protein C1646_753972 [Rhizophagus diaphanus] [Rhizophagus sp. MUCL 43196]